MNGTPVFALRGVTKRLQGGRELLTDISLSFLAGAKIGIIGPNGSGKTTLLRIMAGEDKAFDGEAHAASGITVGYLAQEPKLSEGKTVMQVIEESAKETLATVAEFNEISTKLATCEDPDEMEKLLDKQAQLQEDIDRHDGWDVSRKLSIAMDALGCPAGDTLVDNISGGERRRVALCRLLISQPDFLLLDEPTNHLDATSVAWLERFLSEYAGTVVMITHDRYFLDNVTGWILELDNGRGIPLQGNYSAWLDSREERLRAEDQQQGLIKKQLARERAWINSTLKAGRRHSTARVKSYEELMTKAKAGGNRDAKIVIPVGPRLGDRVVDVKGLKLAHGMVKDMTFSLGPARVMGVIGPNGAGKTQLLRAIAGLDKPEAGSITLGQSVKVGYVDQMRTDLVPGSNVWESISGGNDTIHVGNREVPSRAYTAAIGFKGTDQQKKVDVLSGGERNRVHLARLLLEGCNLLMLDEPTNDLDIDTLRALEEALEDFAGSIIVVSHDRWFLDRIATDILSFDEDGVQRMSLGGYKDYLEQRSSRLGVDLEKADKIKYKKLIR